MILIHTSDLHMGSALTSSLSHEKTAERKRELLSAFRSIANYASDVGARAVLIAGDLFDTEKVTKTTLEQAAAVIGGHKEIDFYYLPGNHEKDAFARSGVDLPENLYFFGDDWTYFELDEVTLAGRCETSADMFLTLSLKEDRKNIVVLHGELRDRSAEGGVIGEKDLPAKVDLLCLGHYHTYAEKAIGTRTRAIYCGTPEGRGFDEVGEKGFVRLDLGERTIASKFIPISKRTLFSVPVDITGCKNHADVSRRVKDEVGKIAEKDIVRAELVGSRTLDLTYETRVIEDELRDRFYYFEVKDRSTLSLDPEFFRFDKSLKGELIRTVSEDDSLSDEMKEAVIRCGIKALVGEV